jgi:hypothetical protein
MHSRSGAVISRTNGALRTFKRASRSSGVGRSLCTSRKRRLARDRSPSRSCIRDEAVATLSPYRCTRSADGHLTLGTTRGSPSRNQQRRTRCRSPARRAGAILRPTTSTTLPIIDVDPGAHASGEHNRRRRPATTCSGSTSTPGATGRIRRRRSSSASARHTVVSATTRSPCSSNSPSRCSPQSGNASILYAELGGRELRRQPLVTAPTAR